MFSAFPFWTELDAQAQQDLLTCGQKVCLPAGKFICLEGDFCQHLPLVFSGSVRVYKIGETGREITLYHLGKGDSCIMTASCIMSQKEFPAFAITETEVEAFTIPAHNLRQWVEHNPIWQNYIFGLFSQRLANVIEIVEEVAFGRMDCRIALFLLKIGDRQLDTISITHEEIAQELGTSREVVSRILKTFGRWWMRNVIESKIKDVENLGKVMNCPKCQSSQKKKNGFRRGKQSFRCKNCGC